MISTPSSSAAPRPVSRLSSEGAMTDNSNQTAGRGFMRGPPVPILGGLLGGMRWLPLARGKILRHIFGSYEPKQAKVFAAQLAPAACVFDIGANTGHYTLSASVLVGPGGRVIAIEPDPRNHYFLAEHLRINRIANATLLHCAIGKADGEARFGDGQRGSGTRRLSKEGITVVPVRSIDSVVAELGIDRALIKMDVEGAELAALKGATETLSCYRPVIIIATHGKERRKACLSLLADRGYRTTAIDARQKNFLCIPEQPTT